jgi:hypothetical protein
MKLAPWCGSRGLFRSDHCAPRGPGICPPSDYQSCALHVLGLYYDWVLPVVSGVGAAAGNKGVTESGLNGRKGVLSPERARTSGKGMRPICPVLRRRFRQGKLSSRVTGLVPGWPRVAGLLSQQEKRSSWRTVLFPGRPLA